MVTIAPSPECKIRKRLLYSGLVCCLPFRLNLCHQNQNMKKLFIYLAIATFLYHSCKSSWIKDKTWKKCRKTKANRKIMCRWSLPPPLPRCIKNQRFGVEIHLNIYTPSILLRTFLHRWSFISLAVHLFMEISQCEEHCKCFPVAELLPLRRLSLFRATGKCTQLHLWCKSAVRYVREQGIKYRSEQSDRCRWKLRSLSCTRMCSKRSKWQDASDNRFRKLCTQCTGIIKSGGEFHGARFPYPANSGWWKAPDSESRQRDQPAYTYSSRVCRRGNCISWHGRQDLCLISL